MCARAIEWSASPLKGYVWWSGVLPALEHKELHHEERVSVGSSALGALVVVGALDDGSGRSPSP